MVTISEELKRAKIVKESLITIGVFDGVHMGHKSLMNRLVLQAKSQNLTSGVVTFSNHPRTVVSKNFQPNYLTSVEERLRLIKETGVDFVVPIKFTKEVASLKADKFTKLLRSELKMNGLMVGPDFQMGKDRESDVSKLKTLSKKQGFTLNVIDVKEIEGLTVRSTSVRDALRQGKIEEATKILGRNHSLEGNVVEGEKRGRELGFPTANFDVSSDLCIPANGIYATFIYIGGKQYFSATSIGTNPTFDFKQHTVETYIMNFEQNIYGLRPKLEFVSKLRDEIAFSSIEGLIEQMNHDVKKATNILRVSQGTI